MRLPHMWGPLCKRLVKLLLNYTPISSSSTDLVSTGYIAFAHTEIMLFIGLSQCASLEPVKCLAGNPSQVTATTPETMK